MGSSESKSKEESDEGRVLDPFLIQWDANGHLRYGRMLQRLSRQHEVAKTLTFHIFHVHLLTGEAHKVDPGRQLVEIMELDYVDDVVSVSDILDSFQLCSVMDRTCTKHFIT